MAKAPPEARLTYKIVEVTNVTDLDLEQAINDWTGQGWRFDGMHFAMRESHRRPSMAFLTFTRSASR